MDSTFSRQAQIKRAEDLHVRRAIQMAKADDVNPDYLSSHPAEVREAVKGNYTNIKKRIHDESVKYHKEVARRRALFVGHD